MNNLTASLKLLNFRFNPEKEIIGKHVYDSELVCIGLVQDWTYSPDRQMKMVVKIGNKGKKNPTILIPFSDIDRVGEHIILATRIENYMGDLTRILNRLRREIAFDRIVNEFLDYLDS